MAKKILYKRDAFLGNNAYHSKGMRDIEQKDEKKKVLNQVQEKKELFSALKKHRDGGVTKKELKSVLASLKYGNDDHFTPKEINTLSQELGLGYIGKKHLPTQNLPHATKIDRAQHAASFTPNRRRGSSHRRLPGDDVVQEDIKQFMTQRFGKNHKKSIVSGELMFDRNEEMSEYVDKNTGTHYFAKTSQLKRPDMHLRNQSSLRGRGIVGGSKNI